MILLASQHMDVPLDTNTCTLASSSSDSLKKSTLRDSCHFPFSLNFHAFNSLYTYSSAYMHTQPFFFCSLLDYSSSDTTPNVIARLPHIIYSIRARTIAAVMRKSDFLPDFKLSNSNNNN